MGHHRRGRLPGETLTPKFFEERETKIDVLEHVALEQPANAEEFPIGFSNYGEEPEPAAGIHRDRALREIALRVSRRAHAAVADELEPRGLIYQFENRRGIVGR